MEVDKMTTPVFYQKPMYVTVTEYTYNVIQHDIAVFQINNNKLLNTIVQNLCGESSADYLYQHESYQSFIETFAGGFIYKLAEAIYSATFGVLSVYMTYSITISPGLILSKANNPFL